MLLPRSFVRACVGNQYPYSMEFNLHSTPKIAITRRDRLGSVEIPPGNFLVSYEFMGSVFYGTGVTKELAVRNVCTRLMFSPLF